MSTINNVEAEWVELQIRSQEVPGSNLGQKTNYLDWDFRGFHKSQQANGGIVS
jgi:hypothetical protein